MASVFATGAFVYFLVGVDIPGWTCWPLKGICQKAFMTLELSNRAWKSFHLLHCATLCLQIHSGIKPSGRDMSQAILTKHTPKYSSREGHHLDWFVQMWV